MSNGIPINIEPLYWFNLAVALLVGLAIWLLKRLVRTLDTLQEKVEELEKDVAYIRGRDRIRRLEDYDTPPNCPYGPGAE